MTKALFPPGKRVLVTEFSEAPVIAVERHLTLVEQPAPSPSDLKEGEILSVLLDDGDPIRNVPRSVENEGHTVLSQERVDQTYRILIRREDND